MKVLLVIFALALPLFAEPAEALCTSTQGDPCLSKAEATEKRYGRYYTDESPCFDYRGKGDVCLIINSRGRVGVTRPGECDRTAPGCGEDSAAGDNLGGGGGGSGGSAAPGAAGGNSGGGGGGSGGSAAPKPTTPTTPMTDPYATKSPIKMTCDNSDLPSKDCSADKSYCGIPASWGRTDEQTMCAYCGVDEERCFNAVCSRGITKQEDKDLILARHNEFRRKVAKGLETKGVGGLPQPAASNMYELKWSDELAKVAQRWTDQCPTMMNAHDKNRNTKQYPRVGQNWSYNAWSAPISITRRYYDLMQGWYNEVKDFPGANAAALSNDGKTGVISHYTQLVWAETKEVGCGYMSHFDGKMYRQQLACNYGPGGNMLRDPVYDTDTSKSCPSGSTENDGLCVW